MPSLTKAAFYGVDLNTAFAVQYNPKALKFDKPVSWSEHANQGKAGTLEFQSVVQRAGCARNSRERVGSVR